MGTAAEFARREIGNVLYRVIMHQAGAARGSYILHEIPSESGIAPAAARDAMETDPRFIETEGRVDVAIRDEIASLSFNVAVDRLTRDYGAFIDIGLLSLFLANVTRRDTSYYRELIERLVERKDAFFELDGKLVPGEYLLFPEDENEDEND